MDYENSHQGEQDKLPPEQAPLPAEFAPSPPEFAPSPAEIDATGREFHDTTRDEPRAKPKKRRLRASHTTPAMLTAAALTVAALTVLPIFGDPITDLIGGPVDFPTLTVSAESRAYLDTVMAALPEGDPETLKALATDDRLRELVVVEAADYIEELREGGFISCTEGEDCTLCNTDALIEGVAHDFWLTYQDGALRAAYMPDVAVLELGYRKIVPQHDPNGEYIEVFLYTYGGRTAQGYPIEDTSYHFTRDISPEHIMDHGNYFGGRYTTAEVDGTQTWPLIDGLIFEGYDSRYTLADGSTSTHHSLYTAKGKFDYAPLPPGSKDYETDAVWLEHYLTDGRLTIVQNDYTGEIDFADGMPQLGNAFTVRGGGGSFTLYRMDGTASTNLINGPAESEEAFLRRLSTYFIEHIVGFHRQPA